VIPRHGHAPESSHGQKLRFAGTIVFVNSCKSPRVPSLVKRVYWPRAPTLLTDSDTFHHTSTSGFILKHPGAERATRLDTALLLVTFHTIDDLLFFQDSCSIRTELNFLFNR
jgi:hypothetical protein